MSDRVDPPPSGPPPRNGPPPPDAPVGPPPPDGPVEPTPESRWRREWWILLALLVLAAAGVVAFLLLRDDGGSGDQKTMPNVVGMQEQQAEQEVRDAGLEPNIEGEPSNRPEGTVISQDPGAGTMLDEGEEVVLGVSRGGGTTTVTETETQSETETETETETTTVTTSTDETETETEPASAAMPDVRGQPYQGAVAALVGVGFLVNSFPVASEESQGTVVAQTPKPQGNVPTDEPVRINVAIGSGPRGTTRVPDVTGPDVDDALEKCAETNVTCLIKFTSAPEADNVDEVVDQEPAAGQSVPTLAQITLFVGR
jgi:beta-lactam-binding protein with PASTA domain